MHIFFVHKKQKKKKTIFFARKKPKYFFKSPKINFIAQFSLIFDIVSSMLLFTRFSVKIIERRVETVCARFGVFICSLSLLTKSFWGIFFIIESFRGTGDVSMTFIMALLSHEMHLTPFSNRYFVPAASVSRFRRFNDLSRS
jgi:hypothetical protein